MHKWKLVLQDGTDIEIPPHSVEAVRKRIVAKEPINLRSRIVPYSQVKSFHETEEDDVQLLAEAASAFDEPEATDDGSLIYTWAKKTIPTDRWNSHYQKIPSYHRVEQLGGNSVIAFKLPLHQVSRQKLNICTDEEVRFLENS